MSSEGVSLLRSSCQAWELRRTKDKELRFYEAVGLISLFLRSFSEAECGEVERTRVLPIRTFACVQLKIKLQPVWQPPIYQQLSEKAVQLRKLGMSNQQIANKLNTHRTMIRKACNYRKRSSK